VSVSLKPLTLEEFLDWERSQPERYEFDGIQPVAMTGGSRPHSRIGTRLLVALAGRVKPPCEAFGPDLKVITTDRVRYPDVSVVCNASDDDESDVIEPTVVCEVVSPSTALTDRRVKAIEYAAMTGILVYLVLEQDRPEVVVRRRSAAWEAEVVAGLDAALELPEISVSIPMALIYGPP
jgi:Uma2 family endonuclease